MIGNYILIHEKSLNLILSF